MYVGQVCQLLAEMLQPPQLPVPVLLLMECPLAMPMLGHPDDLWGRRFGARDLLEFFLDDGPHPIVDVALGSDRKDHQLERSPSSISPLNLEDFRLGIRRSCCCPLRRGLCFRYGPTPPWPAPPPQPTLPLSLAPWQAAHLCQHAWRALRLARQATRDGPPPPSPLGPLSSLQGAARGLPTRPPRSPAT